MQEKIWDQFKLHSCEAYKSLRCTGVLTINDTLSRDQVMHIVSESVLQTLQKLQPPSPVEEPPPATNNQPTLIHTDILSQSANLTVSDVTLQIMQRQMDIMQTMMMQCMQVNPANYNQSRRLQRQPTTQPRKYCWTHGWFNHFGRDCRSKAEGRRDEATKDNRMSGSTRNILPQ